MDNTLLSAALGQMVFGDYADMIARYTGGVGPDYDYRGIPLSMFGEHSGDIGKLPNHPTFSTQSRYSSPEYMGGIWGDNSFMPSVDMIQSGAVRGLLEYMNNVEPGVKLVAPPPVDKKYFNERIK